MCPATLRVDPGQGRHTQVYDFQGYSYHVNKRVVSENNPDFETLYLRCTKYETNIVCRAKAILRRNAHEDVMDITEEHVCHPDRYASCERWLRYEVMEACRNEPYEASRELFYRIASRYPVQVAARFSNHCFRTRIQNARSSLYPNPPQSLRQLGELLEQPRFSHLSLCLNGNGSFYAGTVGPPGEESVLFTSRRLLEYMKKVKVVFADGTFVPTPIVPPGCQVYQICTLVGNNVIPLIQVIMESKSFIAYRSVLEEIRRLVPGFRPRLAMMDFERSPIAAWRDIFGCVIRCCYFHFVKAIIKKMKKLKLTRLLREDRRARSLLRSFLAIPLLPHNMMHRAFFILVRLAFNQGLLYALLSFLSYFWTTWMTGFRYHTLSVYGQYNRTNNACEAANCMLRRLTGPHHPSLWHFLNSIRKYEWMAYLGSRRARAGLCVGSRRRKVSTLRNDMVITDCTAYLLSGNLSIKSFLKITSTRMMSVFSTTLNL